MAATTPISDATPDVSPLASEPQPGAAAQDLWIFRDGRIQVSGPALVRDLHSRLAAPLRGSALLDALIAAGELEAAFADANSLCAPESARLTDTLAALLCAEQPAVSEPPLQILARIQVPSSLTIAPPEGFTYYALHPTDFANVLSRVPCDLSRCAVLGIRSIGTTLSAVVLSALRAEGANASRITVRPVGHPYSRETQFTGEQMRWIAAHLKEGSHFLVVDEGPGRSGSTFLSVAEALQRAGVAAENITMLGSRMPDIDSLCADDAASRWQTFRFVATAPSMNTRFQDYLYAAGGEWRRLFLSQEENWPPSWTQMERLKFLSPDRSTLCKFEGMGPLGFEARARAFVLADAEFGPPVGDAGDGFLAYPLLAGARLSPADLSASVLDRIAGYCAWRSREFASPSPSTQLRDMLCFNVSQEFGVELHPPADVFDTANPVIADARMQPFEWIATASRQLIKTDGVDHGNNHFFPGPCDIAWDLAGAAIEWQLTPEALEYLLQRFQRATGMDVSAHLPWYLIAYCTFRLGFCKMAISTVKGSPEEFRLRRAYLWYRREAFRRLGSVPGNISPEAPVLHRAP